MADPTDADDRSGCDTYCATTRHACQYHRGAEDGRDEDRAAVVAWLRGRAAGDHGESLRWLDLAGFASTIDAIEKGEHRG